MQFFFKYTTLIIFPLLVLQCKSQESSNSAKNTSISPNEEISNEVSVQELEDIIAPIAVAEKIKVGAARYDTYLPLLKGKRVGIVTNQTGVIMHSDTGELYDTIDYPQHTVDFLLQKGVDIRTIFAPEHGFRGKADAGETVKNGKDVQTGLPIISLYGKNKKPYDAQIADLEVIIYDIQDVGARFYTYISTMSYVMEAAAENGKKVIIFDRPNPNGNYIDGPILKKAFTSFVGMHPVPIVYGMTAGEYAQMVNGEKWLKNKIQCDLTVIPVENYTHDMHYHLPIKPSPNLPNDQSIKLYPSTCFFEGTNVSEGRGTDKQFQQYGSPYLKGFNYTFIPQPNEGAKNPRYKGETCYGEDLSYISAPESIELKWLIKAYKSNSKQPFWIKNSGEFWIDKLAGTDDLRQQIDQGWTEDQIKATWQEGLEKFKIIRSKYLLYP